MMDRIPFSAAGASRHSYAEPNHSQAGETEFKSLSPNTQQHLVAAHQNVNGFESNVNFEGRYTSHHHHFQETPRPTRLAPSPGVEGFQHTTLGVQQSNTTETHMHPYPSILHQVRVLLQTTV